MPSRSVPLLRGTTPWKFLSTLSLSIIYVTLFGWSITEVQSQPVKKIKPLKKSDIYYDYILVDNRLIPQDAQNLDLRIFLRSLQGILARKFFDCLGKNVDFGSAGMSEEYNYSAPAVPDYCARLRSPDNVSRSRNHTIPSRTSFLDFAAQRNRSTNADTTSDITSKESDDIPGNYLLYFADALQDDPPYIAGDQWLPSVEKYYSHQAYVDVLHGITNQNGVQFLIAGLVQHFVDGFVLIDPSNNDSIMAGITYASGSPLRLAVASESLWLSDTRISGVLKKKFPGGPTFDTLTPTKTLSYITPINTLSPPNALAPIGNTPATFQSIIDSDFASRRNLKWTKELAIVQKPSIVDFLTDLAIGRRATMCWDPVPGAGWDVKPAPNIEAAMERLSPGFWIGGWWDEHGLVEKASVRGGVVIGSNLAQNLATTSLLEAFDATKTARFLQTDQIANGNNTENSGNQLSESSKSPPNKPKHTVTFVMSDGDNVQWLINGWFSNAWWGNSERGKVPIGWTISPRLADLAPMAAAEYYFGKTGNDSWVTGPSGAGYTYPIYFPNPSEPGGKNSGAAKIASLTGDLMEANAMQIQVIIDGSEGQYNHTKSSVICDPTAANTTSNNINITAATIMARGNKMFTNPANGFNPVDNSGSTGIFYWPYCDAYAELHGNSYIGWVDPNDDTAVPESHGSGASSDSAGPKVKVPKIPVITGRYALWTPGFEDVESLTNTLNAMGKDPSGKYRDGRNANGYSMIPVNAWSHHYNDIVKIVEGLDTGDDGSIEVVSPEEMVMRVRRNVKQEEDDIKHEGDAKEEEDGESTIYI